MARYGFRLRTRANHLPSDSDFSFVPHLEVDGPKEVDTGLVDPQGRPIMRFQDGIGFGKREGWIDE